MPFDMSNLMPGMNPSGSNTGLGGAPTSAPAMGGNTSPFLPTFASGQNTPANTNSLYSNVPQLGPDANMGGGGTSGIQNYIPMNGQPGMATAPSPTGGFQATGATGTGGGPGAGGGIPGTTNLNLGQALGLGQGDPNYMHNLVKALHKAGFSSGVAGQLANFINSGAGFNQDILNNLLKNIFAAQQPQIARGEADINEKFGAMGLGMSSPAALGLGDFLGQVSLDQGELAASMEYQMWNQGVQNFMNVLMGGKGQPPQGAFQDINEWLRTMAQFVPKGN